MKKKNQYLLPRHKFYFGLTRFLLKPFFFIKYGYRAKKYHLNKKQNYLIVSNHNCVLDPLMVTCSFSRPINIVASDDLLKNKFISKLLIHVAAPIAKRKGLSDLSFLKTSLQCAKNGSTILIFPEGNRSYSGLSYPLDTSICKYVRFLKLPLLIYHIDGGYGCDPRWARKSRRGNKVIGSVKKELSKEEIASLSDEELLKIIEENMDNKFDHELKFSSSKKGEYLERILFICPSCHHLETLVSHQSKIICSSCSLEATYHKNLKLSFNNPQINFQYIYQWVDFEKEYLANMEIKDNEVLLSDNHVQILYTKENKQKVLIDTGTLKMYSDKFEVICKNKTYTYLFNDIIELENQGKHKVLFYIGNDYYQFNGEKRFSSYKYYLMYYRIKNKLNKAL
jgi:1-acyl-sn-glycerol-3-phosphate acyltransferase